MTARGHVRRAMGQDLLLEKGKYDENEDAQYEDTFEHAENKICNEVVVTQRAGILSNHILKCQDV